MAEPPNKFSIYLSTCGNHAEAESITQSLLGKRLAACVNIVPKIESHYWWQGKMQKDEEFLLIIKSRVDMKDKLIAAIKELHSYDTPELIQIPITDGLNDYMQWLAKETE